MHSHIGGGGGGETGGRVAASLLPVPQMTFHRGLDRRVDLVFLAFHLPIFRSNVPFTYLFFRMISFVVPLVVAVNKVDVVTVSSIGQVVLTEARTDGYVKSI